MWEYSCRRLQPPTGDPKVQHWDDLREKIISIAANYFHPISSLMFLFKVLSLSLPLIWFDESKCHRAFQTGIPSFVGFTRLRDSNAGYIIHEGVAKWHWKAQRCGGSAAKWCVFSFHSPPQVSPAGEEAEHQRLQWLLSQNMFEEIIVVQQTFRTTKAVQWNKSLSFVKLEVELSH